MEGLAAGSKKFISIKEGFIRGFMVEGMHG